MFTVVQVKAACDSSVCATGEVIVLAVDPEGMKLEWRTLERPQIGDRFNVAITRVPVVSARPA